MGSRMGLSLSTGNASDEPRKPPVPAWLYPIINPTISAVLRSPLGYRLNGVLTVITFAGRKSGRRFSTPVGYSRAGDTVTLLVHRPWWKNFRGGADVSLYLDRRWQRGRAISVEDKAEIVRYLRQRLTEAGGVKNARRMGLTELDTRNSDPTEAELFHAVRGGAVVRVELDLPRRR